MPDNDALDDVRERSKNPEHASVDDVVELVLERAQHPRTEHRDARLDEMVATVVDTLAALTWFCAELGHLDGPVQLCARCSPSGLATYWTRDLQKHLVAAPAECPEHALPFHCKL
jgi:hypothetical protein